MVTADGPTRAAAAGVAPRVFLLGGFLLEVAQKPVALPLHAQRVLAYLCLAAPGRAACPRGTLAERLWLDSAAAQSQASLRTALWRIRQADQRLVTVAGGAVALGRTVTVDLHDEMAWAQRALSGDELAADAWAHHASGELLPGWDEEWLIVERERVRQLRVHALDVMARRLLTLGRHPEAIAAALAAVAAEPLRESAHATLMDIYLNEGNATEAVRQYERYAALLWCELGLAPSQALSARLPRRRSTALR